MANQNIKISPYPTKIKKLSGTSYAEIKKQAFVLFYQIKTKTKRKPYIRSAYFSKQKIFFDFFWTHLFEKNPKERFERLKYFEAALEIMKNSRNKPIVKQNPNKKTETLYRFTGLTKEKDSFIVQIKEDKKKGKKYFMSCFQWEKEEKKKKKRR